MLLSSSGAIFRLVGFFNFYFAGMLTQNFAEWLVKNCLKAFKYTKLENNSYSKT